MSLFSNGKEVVDYFDELLRLHSEGPKSGSEQPVSLLILDINMPIMDGFETSTRVKTLFNEYNKNHE